MSYGFEAINAAGEVVIDGSFPVYELSAPSTVTGTSFGSQGDYSFPLQPSGTLRFWQLGVGDGISRTPTLFIGNKQTFTVRDVVPASSLPAPSGYGMAIYGASGQKVYATNGELLTIGDKYSVELQANNVRPPINVSDSWVAIETFTLNILSSGIPGGGGTGFTVSSGVKKISSTQMEYYGQAFLSAPEVIILNPTIFITAK